MFHANFGYGLEAGFGLVLCTKIRDVTGVSGGLGVMMMVERFDFCCNF